MFLLLAATIMQSGGDMRPVHNSVDTVNAAAAAIVTAESRAEPPAEPVCASTPYCMFFFFFTFINVINYYGVLHGFWLDNLCSCNSLVDVLYFKTSVTACLCGIVNALALQENCVSCNTCHGAFLACNCCRLLIVLLRLIMEECSYAIRLYKNGHR